MGSEISGFVRIGENRSFRLFNVCYKSGNFRRDWEGLRPLFSFFLFSFKFGERKMLVKRLEGVYRRDLQRTKLSSFSQFFSYSII